MLSQYSWGDFFKVTIPLIALYYVWVGWKYYREDIREWISNGGKPSQPIAAPADPGSNDDDSDDVYVTRSYGTALAANQENKEQQGKSEPVEATHSAQPLPDAELAPAVIAQGPAAVDAESTGFDIEIDGQPQHLGEQSLAIIQHTAQRLQTNEEGVVHPVDATDADAVKLADIINQQQGRQALSGLNFQR